MKKIYYTSSEGIYEWSEEAGSRKLVSSKCSFGLAQWNGMFLNVISPGKREHHNVTPRLRYMDSEFRVTSQIKIPGLHHAHQTVVHEDQLYIVDTGNNRVVLFDLKKNTYWPMPIADDGEVFRPRKKSPLVTENNFRHVNSILIEDDVMHLLCHNNWKLSYVLSYRNGKIIDKVEKIGSAAHNLWRMNGELWTCSSREGKIKPIRGGDGVQIEGFLRGMLRTEDAAYVGRSRKKGVDQIAGIYKMDRDMTKVLEFFELPKNWQIFDIVSF